MTEPGNVDQLIADCRRVLRLDSGMNSPSPLLFNMGAVQATLGIEAVGVILLGMSRAIEPTTEDAVSLISEWEDWDTRCCYSGAVEQFLAMKDTLVVAVSYRHAPMNEWKRKGAGPVCKMSDEDQKLFIDAIAGLGKISTVQKVIVWCDRIISTRFKGERRTTGWYNAGLLPYASVRVLQLSEHIPDNELENRVWIRAERSLGRMGSGFVKGSEASQGLIGHLGRSVAPIKLLQNLSHMILSGYWPEDMGFWANDYQGMKKWAFGLTCRTRRVVDPPLFDDLADVDHVEILENMAVMALIPEGLESEESPSYTEDGNFFLKATSWNLAVEKLWYPGTKYISHYMGRLGPYARFTWWLDDTMGTIFGCLNEMPRSTAILAVRHGTHYKLMRSEAKSSKYRHAERTAGLETKAMIAEAARRCGVSVSNSSEWHLLYSSDDSGFTHTPDPEVQEALCTDVTNADVVVSDVYIGTTTKLYRAAVAKMDASDRRSKVAAQVVRMLKEWNAHIRRCYKGFVRVKDTVSGPVWLEGYNDDTLSFGFLDYLTEGLILGRKSYVCSTYSLPSKWTIVQEVKKSVRNLTVDRRLVAEQLFRDVQEGNCEKRVDTSDVARFMLAGGFSKGFDQTRTSRFLEVTAHKRGYWSTKVCCRDSKLQIRFYNESGEFRVAQRSTKLRGFTALGLVDPKDSEVVRSLSIDLSPVQGAAHLYDDYWSEGMADTTTMKELWDSFKHSTSTASGDNSILLVDVATTAGGNREQQPNYTVVESCSGAAISSYGRTEEQVSESLGVLAARLPARQEVEANQAQYERGNQMLDSLLPR